jgi:MoxR-like ATPase
MVNDLNVQQTSSVDGRTQSAIPLEELRKTSRQLLDNVSRVVLGKQDVTRLCVIALYAGEHILLEDVPGVGKTLMGKALARSIDSDFCRIQFTPDLLPSDILGSSVFNTKESEFEFHPGPIFNNFVLADEINRAPPRTQSALLEAMSETQISIDGRSYSLASPFMVIATQNPFEFEGTYQLPESQMDRFLMRISMGYPDPRFEMQIFENHRQGDPVEQLRPICDRQRISEIQNAVQKVVVDPAITEYMLMVIHKTRESPDLSIGVSTRGALAWYRAVQASAFVDGRDYAIPDDARDLAVSILSHRIQPRGTIRVGQRSDVEAIIRDIVSQIPLPE